MIFQKILWRTGLVLIKPHHDGGKGDVPSSGTGKLIKMGVFAKSSVV